MHDPNLKISLNIFKWKRKKIQDKTGPGTSGQDRIDLDQTGEERASQKGGRNRTGQDWGQNQKGHGRTQQDMTLQDRTLQDRTLQDRTLQERTLQDRTGQQQIMTHGKFWHGFPADCFMAITKIVILGFLSFQSSENPLQTKCFTWCFINLVKNEFWGIHVDLKNLELACFLSLASSLLPTWLVFMKSILAISFI